MTFSGARLRLRPRTRGMTQNAQRALQPSWTLSVGRVRSSGNAGAKWKLSPISPTSNWGKPSAVTPDSPGPVWSAAGCNSAEVGTPSSVCTNGRGPCSSDSCPSADGLTSDSLHLASTFAIRCRCEFPTTQATPGSWAISCGRALGVTAGHQDSALGVRAMNAANYLAHFGVGGGGDRAGVQNGDLTLRCARHFLQARLQQLSLECRAIRLARPAAEIEQVKRGHVRNNILAEPAFVRPAENGLRRLSGARGRDSAHLKVASTEGSSCGL